jgi:hypothetical protein
VIRVRWVPVLALALYGYLVATTARQVGLVGEVAASWATARPPEVLPALDAPGEGRAGPLVVSGSRPQLAVETPAGRVPLAVNMYTGGMSDWPARLARAITGDWRAGVASTGLLGGLFLVLAWRFLRYHATDTAAGATALLLATDWTQVFYRKVLGGTEVLLHAAGLLVLWSLWSRRWKGGVHGTVAIAVGVGLGLHAKVTFVATLAAFGVAAWGMRWDRAALKPPRQVAWWLLATLPALGVAPLALDVALQAANPALAIRSHDTLALQLARLAAPSPSREGWMNLAWFFGSPQGFLAVAYGGEAAAPVSGLRFLGFALAAWGAILEWRARTPTSGAALLRFLSIAVPLQIAFLFLANHDLHHLAQATPPLLLLVALGADRVAAEFAPPRSGFRSLVTGFLILPHLVAGVLHLRATDPLLGTLPRSTFVESGQRELVALVEGSGCATIYTTDYEAYGMLDARAPGVRVVHLWGAIANGDREPVEVLSAMTGACYLSIRPTAPMIYDWHPSRRDLDRATKGTGLDVVTLGELRDGDEVWAGLYEVGTD